MEGLIMKKLCHPNILNMIGISMYEDKPCIILPLMHNGDLKKYLLANRSVRIHIILSLHEMSSCAVPSLGQ